MAEATVGSAVVARLSQRQLHSVQWASDASPSEILIRQLTKAYGPIIALDQVDLDVRKGEFLTLLGPSGSGKSTLLMILAGFTRPTAGSVKFGGREMVLVPPHKRDVGVVFQNYALFPHMNVFQNVAYPLRIRKMASAEISRRVQGVLNLVRLPDCMSRAIGELSGGQQQRVAIARAIVFEPKILLMDEPLSALDKKLREEMQIELRHLHEKLGITTVYVTHDQREALTLSDRVAILNMGAIAQIGTPRDLYERPRNKFVATFIGESTLLDVAVNGGVVYLGNHPLPNAERLSVPDGKAHLVIRPEKLKFASPSDPACERDRFNGVLAETIYQGDSLLLRISLKNGHDLFMRMPGHGLLQTDHPINLGDEVSLTLSDGDPVVVPSESGVSQ
jgi:putative spermidine/putrescine transport system ATP-binding protein